MTQPSPAVSLTLDGDFYPRFIEGKSYSAEALQAIQESVRKLLEQPTSINKPGMLLGKVQSGKTKTFMGIMALGFDNAFDVCVVLTKGTKLTFEAGYSWDVPAFIACMQYLSKSEDAGTQAGSVWCLVRKDRKARRFLQSSPTEFYDAPDTSHIEGDIAKKVATQIPMLMLFRQNGAEAQEWMGAPFYWPVLYSPKNTKTAIFASDVVDED